ncbi:hypothetical protein C5B42_02375 [Candidatus Cerribacteria bacterium 'Amazon FNV 2010 28 9']|uniref:Uncharacterized protein n=1 Tax=Candidatus Cerribacteria bacterium 'Amazon FNV 2010 28 9' TaxID=2081795 RepID=A0A317JQI3_9BACT|nr:MAG: hypothetical protein C5B42_02375 [Candidatus Cerribacteria bacterium 'Amazon FNV 2010 28 9']
MNKRRFFVPVIVLLIAVCMRLPHLNGSFWLDEAAQALESSRPLADQYKIQDDFQPPLFHYLTHFMIISGTFFIHLPPPLNLPLGQGERIVEWWLRSTSLFAGLASVALLFLILQKKGNQRTAIVGSLLFATSSFHIFYSQELRPYALACFFACLSWIGLLGGQKAKVKGAKWSDVIFVVATIGGMYSMYLYPLITLSQILYVWFEQKPRFVRTFFLSLFSFLFFLPWLPFFLGQLKAGTTLTQTLPGWAAAVATPQLKALPLVFLKFFIGQVEIQGSLALGLLAGIPVFVFLLMCLYIWKQKKYRMWVYWFFVPIIAAWMVSFIVPVIQPKRVMIALPAMWGIIAIVTEQLGEKKKRIIAGICLLVFFITNIGTSVLYYTVPAYQREDWRTLISRLEKQESGSIALFAFPSPYAPWVWYNNGSIRALASGSIRLNTIEDANVYKIATASSQIIVFDYLRDLTDPNHSTEKWLRTKGYHQSQVLDGKQIGFVRIFSKE